MLKAGVLFFSSLMASGLSRAQNPAPPSATPQASAPEAQSSLNELILQSVKEMPRGGQYSTGTEAFQKFQTALKVDAQGKLQVNPNAATPSFCSSATYLVFTKTLQKLHNEGKITLDKATLSEIVSGKRLDGEGLWGRWNANGPGTAKLFADLGLGTNFTDFSKAKPGDFMKVFWNDKVGAGEKGHSVIYTGTKQVEGVEHVCFWSSNQATKGASEGYGIKCVPRSDIKNAIFSRLEQPESLNKFATIPRTDLYLNGLKTKDSSFEIAKAESQTDQKLPSSVGTLNEILGNDPANPLNLNFSNPFNNPSDGVSMGADLARNGSASTGSYIGGSRGIGIGSGVNPSRDTLTSGPLQMPSGPLEFFGDDFETLRTKTSIKDIVNSSTCKNQGVPGRGKMPYGYVAGMATVFAKSLCRKPDSAKGMNRDVKSIMMGPSFQNDDTLRRFGVNANAPSAKNLAATYAIMLTLGMRESSGNIAEGTDKSAGYGRTGAEIEAGLFQVSPNSMAFSPALKDLFYEYLSGQSSRKCLDVTFTATPDSNHDDLSASSSNKVRDLQQKIRMQDAHDRQFMGTDSNQWRQFRTLMKSCPAFAAEYTATLLRLTYKHHGPLIRKHETPILPGCLAMFSAVASYIQQNQAQSCSAFEESGIPPTPYLPEESMAPASGH